MGDDWQRIEEWATIFSEPTKLAEVAGKNWLLHHNRIERDIHMAEADWQNGLYFESGTDTAYALVDLVGPVPPASPQ